jgi:hypothetical protein
MAVTGSAYSKELCVECITLKLDRPIVVRGPSSNEPDAPVSVIKLPSGGFRGFAANGVTVAIDGQTPTDLGGPAKVVLKPGPPHSPSECGRWLTSVLPSQGTLYGLVHDEEYCHENEGKTRKSMSIAVSQDNGLNWRDLGQIIIGDDSYSADEPGGLGDCTAADGHDGYWYAYCLRPRDWKNIVTRAPAGDPSPGKWKEWTGSEWDASALGGTGAPLADSIGMSSAYWLGPRAILLLNAASNGLQLSISKNKIDFETLTQPLIAYDASNWQRPAPTELYAYPAMIADTGLSNISHDFLLAYLYIPPDADFSQRYLVMQQGRIDLARSPASPQVRTALSRWTRSDGASWTTTGPPILAGHSFRYAGGLGYLMTAPPRDGASVALDECFSSETGNGFLTETGTCTLENSERRRTAGYAYRSFRPQTIPLFSCLAKNGTTFVSNHSDCKGAGLRERLLGYALQ